MFSLAPTKTYSSDQSSENRNATFAIQFTEASLKTVILVGYKNNASHAGRYMPSQMRA